MVKCSVKYLHLFCQTRDHFQISPHSERCSLFEARRWSHMRFQIYKIDKRKRFIRIFSYCSTCHSIRLFLYFCTCTFASAIRSLREDIVVSSAFA